MADILLINIENLASNELLEAVTGMDINVVHETTLNRAQQLLQQYKFRLVLCINQSLGESNPPMGLELPEHVPILMVVTNCKPETYTQFFPSSHLIDVLTPPYSNEQVAHKIQFLLKVGQQAEDLLRARSNVVALQEKIVDLHRSVDGHNSFLELISRRDGLTGLYNRRHFNNVIKEIFTKTQDSQDDLALLILNIDYFSEINKSCGQDFGDFVLNELSARLINNSRKDDIYFRLSGEEFAVLMPSTPEKRALEIAERIRITSEQKSYDNGHYVRTVTISVGIATLQAHAPFSHEELINMADQALFLAKSEGRNRCMSHSPIDKDSYGTAEQNFKILQDTVSRILDKTKISTMRSLQLLAQAILEGKENEQIALAQYYAELICKQLNFPPMLIDTFKNAIMLLCSIRHLMYNEMINKEGALTSNEWEVISDFPYKLAQITELFDYFSKERAILLHHGENYDGTGYPEGLKGDEIPMGARIFNLANAVAAMNTDRPYRRRLEPQEILDELLKNAGTQFDPNLVAKLIDVIEETGILEVERKALDHVRKKIATLALK